MDSSKAAYEWDKKNTTMVAMKLQNRTDRDILDLFGSLGNRQGYIKRLIRDDLDGEKKYLQYLKIRG
mgnify:CR=1 FL=1